MLTTTKQNSNFYNWTIFYIHHLYCYDSIRIFFGFVFRSSVILNNRIFNCKQKLKRAKFSMILKWFLKLDFQTESIVFKFILIGCKLRAKTFARSKLRSIYTLLRQNIYIETVTRATIKKSFTMENTIMWSKVNWCHELRIAKKFSLKTKQNITNKSSTWWKKCGNSKNMVDLFKQTIRTIKVRENGRY